MNFDIPLGERILYKMYYLAQLVLERTTQSSSETSSWLCLALSWFAPGSVRERFSPITNYRTQTLCYGVTPADTGAAWAGSSKLTAQRLLLNRDLLESSFLSRRVLNDTYTSVFLSLSYMRWTRSDLKRSDLDSLKTSYYTCMNKK
jgi:hypothetical protein